MQEESEPGFPSPFPTIAERKRVAAGNNLYAKIHLPGKPAVSNGTWDEVNQVTTWNRSINARESPGIPDLLYAIWFEPNQATQQKQFGKVVLEEWDLGFYAIWYAGLNEEERSTWNKFLGQLEPGNAVGKLKEFKGGEPFRKWADFLLNRLQPSN